MFVAFALLAFQELAPADFRRTFAVGKEAVYYMMPPVAICDGEVRGYAWSDDGSCVFVRQETVGRSASEVSAKIASGKGLTEARDLLDPQHQILLWDLKSGKSRSVLGGPAANSTIEEVVPMTGSNSAIVVIRDIVSQPGAQPLQPVKSYFVVSGSTGQFRQIYRGVDGGTHAMSMMVSKQSPLGVLFGGNGSQRSAQFFDSAGRVSKPWTLPEETAVQFDGAGDPQVISLRPINGQFSAQRIDPFTGALGPAHASIPPRQSSKPEGTLIALQRDVPIPEGGKATIILLRVAGGEKDQQGIVSTDGLQPLVSPHGDAIIYRSQGGLFARRLVKVPRALFESTRDVQLRSEAVHQAEQVGQALLMYSLNHGGNLPGQGDDFQRTAAPYLKDPTAINGFCYTFTGGPTRDVAAPGSTELGYVPGPGGRAVVYTDGHAKWIPDKP